MFAPAITRRYPSGAKFLPSKPAAAVKTSAEFSTWRSLSGGIPIAAVQWDSRDQWHPRFHQLLDCCPRLQQIVTVHQTSYLEHISLRPDKECSRARKLCQDALHAAVEVPTLASLTVQDCTMRREDMCELLRAAHDNTNLMNLHISAVRYFEVGSTTCCALGEILTDDKAMHVLGCMTRLRRCIEDRRRAPLRASTQCLTSKKVSRTRQESSACSSCSSVLPSPTTSTSRLLLLLFSGCEGENTCTQLWQ